MKFQVNDNEFQLQKCLNCVILLLSLFEFITKKKLHTWKSALTKFSQDALIRFVELIPHFRIFVRTYNWNHYRPIRVNVISLQLKSIYIFFLAQSAKFWVFGLKIFKNECLIWIHHFRNRIQAKFH